MRTKSMLLTSVVVCLAVVAGLLGIAGTWAVWNASVKSDAGTVHAATFHMKVNGKTVQADGSAISVTSEDPSAELSPTKKVYLAVTVTNATNATGPFDVEASLGVPAPSRDAEAEMHEYLTLRTAPLASEKCSSVSPSSFTAKATSMQIDKGGSATYCVEVGFKTGAPPSLGGKKVNLSLPLSVSQLPAGS